MTPLCESTRKLVQPLESWNAQGSVELFFDSETNQLNIEVCGKVQAGYRSPPNHEVFGRIASIPGIHRGHIPNTFYAVLGFVTFDILHALRSSGLSIIFLNDQARYKWMEFELLGAMADICAQRVAKWKASKEVPPECLDLEYIKDGPLAAMGNQLVCARNMLDMPGYGSFMRMGTGKTPTAIITACNIVKQHREAGETRPIRVLVICPNQVRLNWQREFATFTTRPTKITRIQGSDIGRLTKLAQSLNIEDTPEVQLTVSIIGQDTLRVCQQFLSMVEWDFIVLDEAHNFVNGRTARVDALMKLRSSKRAALTGTPIRNTPLDLYQLMEWLIPGVTGFTSQKSFNAYYGDWVRGGGGYSKLEGILNLPMLKENLARCSMVVSKEEVLNLPDKVYRVVEVGLTAKQKEVYKQLAEQLALEIEQDLAGINPANKSMIIQNILVKLLRLSQVTSGFVNWPDIFDPVTGIQLQAGHTEYFSTSPKIQAVMDILLGEEKTELDKTIIWCHHLPELAWMAATLKANGVDFVEYHGGVSQLDREKAIDRYNNDPKCGVFLGNPATGGVGTNLLGYDPKSDNPQPTNTTEEIFMSQGWSSILREQAEDRGHRKGGRVAVTITTLVVPGSIDTQIDKRVMDKRDMSLETQDLKDLLAVLMGEDPE